MKEKRKQILKMKACILTAIKQDSVAKREVL